MELVDKVLHVMVDGPVKRSQVNDIILTGNQAHIDRIQPLFEDHFPNSTIHKHSSIRSDEAVVKGAVIRGDIVSADAGCECCGMLMDVNPPSLGSRPTVASPPELLHAIQ